LSEIKVDILENQCKSISPFFFHLYDNICGTITITMYIKMVGP